MSSIRFEIDDKKQLTLIRVQGKPTIEDYIKGVRDYYKKDTTLHLLWDFTQGNVSGLSGDELRRAIRETRKVIHSRGKGKTAFVFPTVHGFGLGRMLETFAELEEMPVEFRTYHSLKAAYDWLGVKP